MQVTDNQLVEIMFSLSRIMKEEMTFDSDALQLTLLQLQALVFIKKNESTTMSEIAKHFKISLPTATSLSDKLVLLDLIERQNDLKDRRIVKLVLTKKGIGLLKKAMEQRSKKVNAILSYLSEDEKEQLLHIMQNLLTNIQKQNEK